MFGISERPKNWWIVFIYISSITVRPVLSKISRDFDSVTLLIGEFSLIKLGYKYIVGNVCDQRVYCLSLLPLVDLVSGQVNACMETIKIKDYQQ